MIAHNVCVAQLRSGQQARTHPSEPLQELDQHRGRRGSDRHEELFGLRDALAAMPENLRLPLLLREWQGLSYAQIVEALEIPAPAVGTVIFRARRQLARALENGAKKQLRRVAQALNLGPILAAGRSLLAGAGGAKLGATGVGVLAV